MKKIYITIISATVIFDCVSAADFINKTAKEIAVTSPASICLSNTQNAQLAELKAENVLENPEISFSHLWGQNGIGNKYTVGISQSFDWPGVYSARRKVISARQRAISDFVTAKTADVFLSAKECMIDAVYAKRLISLRSLVFKQVDSLYNALKKAKANGDVTVLDLNRAAIERSVASRNLREAETMLLSATNSLQALNKSFDSKPVISNLLNYPTINIKSEQEYADYLIKSNPEILTAKAEVEISDLQQALVSASRLPSFSVGYEHEYEMGERFNGLSLSLTLPVYSRKNAVKAASYNKIASENSLSELEASASNEVVTLRQKILVAMTEIEAYGNTFSDYQNITMLQRLLSVGQISLSEYITELTYFIDAQVEYEQLVHDMHIDAANLNKFVDFIE